MKELTLIIIYGLFCYGVGVYMGTRHSKTDNIALQKANVKLEQQLEFYYDDMENAVYFAVQEKLAEKEGK